jgi:NAD(P)H-hydrate epimerase
MYAVTAQQMRDIENNAVKDFGMPSLILMENAAVRTALHILRLSKPTDSIAVVCGPGNNGGDGFAIARQLFAQGRNVRVVCAENPSRIKGDALVNFEICERLSVPFVPALDATTDMVVDALFGTGLTRPAEGVYAEAIRAMNKYGKKIISVDIPSGFCADTGKALGETVRAHGTVTFGFPKRGLFLYPCAGSAGELWVEGISIPEVWDDAYGPWLKILNEDDVRNLMPVRKPTANKGSHGRVCVVAGSPGMPGAAVLCCTAAYRAGAGLVEAFADAETASALHFHVPEAITSPRSDVNPSAANVVLLGPGLGVGEAVLLEKIFNQITCPLVLDADGLNIVAKNISMLRGLSVPCVITPHPAEMSRLTGLTIRDITDDPVSIACSFAKEHQVHVLLKGARTVVAFPDGNAVLNTTGSAALAKAGTGDVLAGIIAGLAAQGMDIGYAAACGAYLHGKAGESLSLYGALAREVADAVPGVMERMQVYGV